MLGDFALNSAWDDFGADPTMVDLFRWHGSEEVEHRCVAHDVATYFHDSYLARIIAMAIAATLMYAFFERATYYLCRTDPDARMSWWKMERLRMRDSKLRSAAGVSQGVREHHPGLLRSRLLPAGRRIHCTGRRLPRHLSGRTRR